MSKKLSCLFIALFILGGILASLPASYAMTKTEKPATFGCQANELTVQKNGNNWIIRWQYDTRLKGTQVKINLYQNGKLLWNIADNIAIGINGRGSWSGLVPPEGQPSLGFDLSKGFQIELVSKADSSLRVMRQF